MQPKVLVAEYDRGVAESIFCQVARLRKIPSFTLIHGLMKNARLNRDLWSPFMADKIIVWGNWMREFLINSGEEPERILVGGLPRLEAPSDEDGKKALARLNMGNIDSQKPRILLFSSSLAFIKPAHQYFIELAQKRRDLIFFIRPHPVENMQWYKEALAGKPVFVQDPKEWSFSESVASSEIIVGTNSTSLIEAVVVGKKVVQIITEGEEDILDANFPMIQEAVSLHLIQQVHNSSEFERSLDMLLSNDQVDKTYQDEVCNLVQMFGDEAAKATAHLISGTTYEKTNV